MLINLYDKENKRTITIAIDDKIDNFGNNVCAWIAQTKEERESKAKRNYFGNGKVVFIDPNKTISVAPKQEFKSDDKTPF
jgi:hypothetical protein